MSDYPIETTDEGDEGGDPACWAHLFDDEGRECNETPPHSPEQRSATARQAASRPDSEGPAGRS